MQFNKYNELLDRLEGEELEVSRIQAACIAKYPCFRSKSNWELRSTSNYLRFISTKTNCRYCKFSRHIL